MSGSSKFASNDDSWRTKLYGAYDGLQQAWNKGVRKVVLELDSLEVVHMLLSLILEIPHFAVAWDVKHSIRNQWELKIQHVYRE
ncbi:hypothetical protein PVK06_005404 [Gossypium arboreum]|uniref:RNase H type-1 domain-containing protein n=1 Tax=Gossypium arboreum TaxID=29729 RepID=A0ABR0QUI5_GOSAR|nr:hypothetical protein PVK06_005404 [Gossypium arboreum]